jgi:hypothetical protein
MQILLQSRKRSEFIETYRNLAPSQTVDRILEYRKAGYEFGLKVVN